MERKLTRREWAKVNQEVDFDELAINMEVTVDGTDEAGWYKVIGIRNWASKNDFVELKMMEMEE